jgi:orotate phosphoribosyltransferase
MAGAEVIGMVAMFTYGFPEAEKAFKEAGIRLMTLSNYGAMLDVALKTGFIADKDVKTLQEWRKDPANWTPALSLDE